MHSMNDGRGQFRQGSQPLLSRVGSACVERRNRGACSLHRSRAPWQAISGPLFPVSMGLFRALADAPSPGPGCIGGRIPQIPKLTTRVRPGVRQCPWAPCHSHDEKNRSPLLSEGIVVAY
jgi:hypothetical protein